jgi:hypothetical protein
VGTREMLDKAMVLVLRALSIDVERWIHAPQDLDDVGVTHALLIVSAVRQ